MQTPAPALPPLDSLPEWVGPFLAVVLLASIAAWLLKPLVRAWAKRIEGQGDTPAVQEELAQLRERVAELEAARFDVQEIAERLDFAERMLTQRNEAMPLPLHRTPV